jgi:glycogen synthase
MTMYQVVVTSFLPYPISFEYTIKASGMATAIARAVRLYKKEPRVFRKRMDNMSVKVGAAKF